MVNNYSGIPEDKVGHEPMRLYCDNKHIEMYRHFIKEKLHYDMISTPYMSTQYQFANILTKGLNCINLKD